LLWIFLKQYLTQEFSEENLLFWTDVENYKRLPSYERFSRAKEIFSTYIVDDSPLQVNIDSDCNDAIKNRLSKSSDSNTPLDLFDEAQSWVCRLMESHSFPRFIKSNKYKSLLERLWELGEDEIDNMILQDLEKKKSR